MIWINLFQGTKNENYKENHKKKDTHCILLYLLYYY